MASSSEAFAKFSQWKNDRSWLKVTEIVDGKTIAVFSSARISAFDSEAEVVGIALEETRMFRDFDVEGATFSVEPLRIAVTRWESDWLIFEESDLRDTDAPRLYLN